MLLAAHESSHWHGAPHSAFPHPSPAHPHGPVIGAKMAKWFAPLMCALLGFTNGYVGTYSLVVAPGRVGEKSRGRVGAMMVFFLTFGLCIGSWLGVGAAFWMHLGEN